MNWNYALMNPPYNRSLHLKFLEDAIKISDTVVTIQPVRWLTDPLNPYKKSSDINKYKLSIAEHIRELEIMNIDDIKYKFNIIQQMDVGIYVCDEYGGYDYNALIDDIVKDAVKYIHNNKIHLDYNKNDGIRLRIPQITGGKAQGSGYRPPYLSGVPIKDIIYYDGKHDGKWWYEYYGRNQYSKTTEEITCSVKFNTENEAHNFLKQFNTNYVRYINNFIVTNSNINDNKILWMGNAVHPRTGNIGYIDEWTNDDFFEFFNINAENKQMINDFVTNADKELDDWLDEHKKHLKRNRK